MSDYVLPNLPGIQVEREPEDTTNTSVFRSPGGRVQTYSWQTAILRRFHVRYGFLRDDVAAPAPWSPYSEAGILRWFFKQHLGPGGTFLWDDPDARKNLLAYSQALATSPWYNSGGVTNNIIVAPDGTTTGSRIVGMAADSYVAQASLFPPAGAASLSLWAKATSSRTVNFHLIRSSPWTILGQVNAALTTAWQRFQCSGTALGDECIAYLGGESTIGIGVEVHLWGAQVEPGSSAGLYVPTDASPMTGRYRVRFAADSFRLQRLGRYAWGAEFDLEEALS